MACAELDRLRQEAKKINQELTVHRRAARVFAASHESNRDPGGRDFEWFLERKLHNTSATIEQHIAQHRCEV